MTCLHKNHRGKPRCTKSESIHRSGGEEGALRRLMYWAFLGVPACDRAAHKNLWEVVCKAWEDGTVPTLAELDDGRMPLLSD